MKLILFPICLVVWGSFSFVEVFLKYIEAECDGGKEDQVQFCFQTNFSILWPPPTTTTEPDHFRKNGPKIISSMVDKTNHSFKEEEKQFQRRAKSCPVKVLHMGSRACKFWICKFDSFETGRVLQFPSFFAFSQFQVFFCIFPFCIGIGLRRESRVIEKSRALVGWLN